MKTMPKYILVLLAIFAARVRGLGIHRLAYNYISEITSPSYPENYENDLDCEWSITAPNGYQVLLTFATINTEACCDYVEVLDGSTSLGRFSGENHNEVPLVSTTGRLLVYFHSDGQNTKLGFYAFYRTARNCGGHVTATSDIAPISSFSPTDLLSQDCFWVIEAEDEDYKVNLTLNKINTQGCCIYSEVFEGMKSLGRIDGNVTDTTSYISEGNRLTLYVNLHATTGGVRFREGFYRQISLTDTCQSTLNAQHSANIIQSPGYPSAYRDNLECHWTITARDPFQIVFKLLDLDTEACCDFLEVFDGNTSLGRYSGYVESEITMISFTSTLRVVFQSNENVNASRGFKAIYRQATNCGSIIPFKTTPVWLKSPNYPANYPNNLECFWILRSRPFMQVQLDVADVDTEDCCAYLQVLDGSKSVAKLRGEITEPRSFVSEERELRVYFHSDASDSFERRGFRAIFKEVCNHHYEVVSTNWTKIFSLGFPYFAPNDADCYYDFETTPGSRIELLIDTVDTVSCCDYLEIFDGLNPNGRFRTIHNHSIRSSGQTMRFHYHTDVTPGFQRFVVSYRMI